MSRCAIRLPVLAAATVLAGTAWAATFGTVVPIGGQAADIALDEARQAVYVANFTAGRIDVISTVTDALRTSINVAPRPGSLALSPDGRFLVVTHYGNFASPATPANALTVITLEDGRKQTFGMGSAPLGVAFGVDDLALVVTTSEVLLFDPVSGAVRLLDTITGLAAKVLPVPGDTLPPEVLTAALAVSGDGTVIYGIADSIRFRYDVMPRRLTLAGYTATPPLGPRVIAVNRDGSFFAAGWAMFDWRGTVWAQFPRASGQLALGTLALDSAAGILYAQVPQAAAETPPGGVAERPSPVLWIADADNLAIRERLRLPENTTGRALLSSHGETLYAVSESGLMVLPVGRLARLPRVKIGSQAVVLRGNACAGGRATAELEVSDPGGNRVPFSLTTDVPGVTFSPAAGLTPARVKVEADLTPFRNRKGAVVGTLNLQSDAAVNVPDTAPLVIVTRDPDQRGTAWTAAGKLVDLLADPVRDRFYILRQDTNQVLVYDSASYALAAVLRTGNTPTQMAITADRQYLLVGHDNSQLAHVYDLEKLERLLPVVFPPGHYPRSIVVSGNAILAASRVVGADSAMDRIDLPARRGWTLPSLGNFENKIHPDTVLAAAANGASILVAMADGRTMLYDAAADTFTTSRKDFAALSGAVAASNYNQYVVNNHLLNASLVPAGDFQTSTGASPGFVFVDRSGLRATATGANPATLERVNPPSTNSVRPVRIAEAAAAAGLAGFSRSLAVLRDRGMVVVLTVSGFTVLPWDYDVPIAPPRIDRVVNAADFSTGVAPGGLVTIFGERLSPLTAASLGMPLPTALAESCLTINGFPMPMLFVSSSQINAQIPFQVDGMATMVLRTPDGVSDNYSLSISPVAPSVFRNGAAGPETGIPAVYRVGNGQLVTVSNPIHPGDRIAIYATGLGRTKPEIEAGAPAASDPLAWTVEAPQVTLGGVALPVTFAGLAPGAAGVYQVNATVPAWVPEGLSVPLTLIQGGASTTLAVRVVR